VEAPALFTFPGDHAVDATDLAREHAIRPAVVLREVCGGNPARNGAQQVATRKNVDRRRRLGFV
jgi:hypothetical protein